MKRILFLITIFCALEANAQTYIISFTGIGPSTTVSSVEVENLTSGATANITSSGQTLTLTVTTSVNLIDNKQSKELKIYPNPMTDNSILQVYPPAAGDAIITVFDMTGKQVAQVQSYLNNYLQEFRLSGINRGLYLVSVKGSTYQYSGKLLSNVKVNGTASIEKVSNNVPSGNEKTTKTDSKGEPGTINMEYTTGDRLKFIGISGNYSTVITDIPTETKTITFNFISCTDADNNNYPVVEIGTQIWMAENLKYLPSVIGPGTGSETIPYYYVYGYNGTNVTDAKATANYTTYGVLYNWPAVMSGVCPTGWHAPTDLEWTELFDYLGGESLAGGKLKETGTTHWTSPNEGATNEIGFTALPGGDRDYDGAFYYIGDYGLWRSATEYDSSLAWSFFLFYNYSTVNSNNSYKKYGFSVRCLKD